MTAELLSRGLRFDKRAATLMLPALLAGAIVIPAYLDPNSSSIFTLNSYGVASFGLLAWLGGGGVSILALKLGARKHKTEEQAGQPEPGEEPTPFPQSEPAPENPEAIPEGGVPEPLPLGSLSSRNQTSRFRFRTTMSVDGKGKLDPRTEDILASLREALEKNLKAGFAVASIEVRMKPVSELGSAQELQQGSQPDSTSKAKVVEEIRTETTEQMVVAAPKK